VRKVDFGSFSVASVTESGHPYSRRSYDEPAQVPQYLIRLEESFFRIKSRITFGIENKNLGNFFQIKRSN
jgi:hypothetical protein